MILKKIILKGLQGDDATFIHVSKDGRYIQLSDNEKQLQYDLKTKQQKDQLDKKRKLESENRTDGGGDRRILQRKRCVLYR